MVVYCTVCLNNTRKNKDISYFNYPKEYNRRQYWLEAVGRLDLLLKLADDKTRQQYRICEEHFERNCFKFSKKGTVKYLFGHAFPTLKLPSNEGASSSSIQVNAFPTVNLPSNTDANLNQFENISIQENPEIQLFPTSEIPSNSNNFLNKIVILEDDTSRNIQTESDIQNTNRSAQTALHLSANTPRKRKLALELREDKKNPDIDNITKEDFLKLCDKFMTKSMSRIIKSQMDVKAGYSGNLLNCSFGSMLGGNSIKGGNLEVLEDISVTSLSDTELGRKRLFSEGSESSGSDTETEGDAPRKRQPVAKRGKSHTLTRARAALRERTEQKKEDDFQLVHDKRAFKKPKEVSVEAAPSPIEVEVEKVGVENLMQAAESNLEVILGLAGKSINLSGTDAAKIRRTAGSIKEIIKSLVVRTETEEARLRANNARLQRELNLARDEARSYRKDFEESRKKSAEMGGVPGSADLMKEAQMVGNIVDDHLATLQLSAAPPCRPPLAGDSRPLTRETRAAIAASKEKPATEAATQAAKPDPAEFL